MPDPADLRDRALLAIDQTDDDGMLADELFAEPDSTIPSHNGDGPPIDMAELQRRLHDGVLQLLEFMSVGGWGSLTNTDEYRELARRAADDLRETVESASLEGPFGLALDRIKREGSRLDPSIEWVLEVDPKCGSIDAAAIEPLIRATREAANNCVRHAKATTITVRAECVDGVVMVDVVDDGLGFKQSRDGMGFGLQHSVLGRVARAGGIARISALERRGTCVHMELRSTTKGRLTCR
ncbi:MAG: liaS [Thermoleophilia bacterium]|nr:liaS [Thermoleophilia bacterium]